MAEDFDKTPEVVVWKLYRSAIEHENDLVHNRLTWLLQSQAFLFTAFGVTSGLWLNTQAKQSPDLLSSFLSLFGLKREAEKIADFLPVLLALICAYGIWLCFCIHRGVQVAHEQLDTLQGRHDLFRKSAGRLPIFEHLPPLQRWGGRDHFWTGTIEGVPRVALFVWVSLLALTVRLGWGTPAAVAVLCVVASLLIAASVATSKLDARRRGEHRRPRRDIPKEFLRKQRWFGAKSRTITGTEIIDTAVLPHTRSTLKMVSISYVDGPADTYLLPLIGESDAAGDQATAAALLAIIENESRVPTRHGLIQGLRGAHQPSHAALPSRLSGSEQSNSSIIFGDLLILKLFRRQEPGENPDCELSRYLTERTSFRQIAPFAGSIEYYDGTNEPYTLAMLQGLVANEGDGWNWTLQNLTTDTYLAAAAILGRRTAEMHAALATFDPEPLKTADLERLASDMTQHAQRSLACFDRLRHINPRCQRIRIHGDYHLGQILRVPNDFVILDFEGEPSKSLAERRAKHCPLKDVAGMLRSFSYASYSAFLEEPQRQDWEQTVSAAFLQAYRQEAGNAAFLPADQKDFDTLLEAYVVDKAFYELNYERNNRPDWVHIPLAAISASHGEDFL